jgi:hypothetical protein
MAVAYNGRGAFGKRLFTFEAEPYREAFGSINQFLGRKSGMIALRSCRNMRARLGKKLWRRLQVPETEYLEAAPSSWLHPRRETLPTLPMSVPDLDHLAGSALAAHR